MNIAYLSEKLLLTLGVLKLTLVAIFFVSFPFVEDTQVHAQDACIGDNLLEKIEQDDPESFESILANAAKTKNGNSILWRVEKEGLPSSWLFGTMHMADPRISTLPSDVMKALDGVETLVLETTDILDPEGAKEAMSEITHLTLMPFGSTLKDLVSDDLEDKLDAAVSARGIPAFLANRMQPWLIATTVALPVCEIERKNSGEAVLDVVIGEYAKKNGIEVKGLETSVEQLQAIASLPQDYHVSALEETLKSDRQTLDMNETMKQLYLKGEIAKILPLMEAISPESFTGEGATNFQTRLIHDRNVNMAERVIPILEKESTFVAVGALHLPGETGLVKLLRDKGYTVTSAR